MFQWTIKSMPPGLVFDAFAINAMPREKLAFSEAPNFDPLKSRLRKHPLNPAGEQLIHFRCAPCDADGITALRVCFFCGDVPRTAIAVSRTGDKTIWRDRLSSKLVFDETLRRQMQH